MRKCNAHRKKNKAARQRGGGNHNFSGHRPEQISCKNSLRLEQTRRTIHSSARGNRLIYAEAASKENFWRGLGHRKENA